MCQACGMAFQNRQQLGGHMSQGFCTIRRADYTPPLDVASVSSESEQVTLSDDVSSESPSAAVASEPRVQTIQQLLQRPEAGWAEHRIVELQDVLGSRAAPFDAKQTLHLEQLQAAYDTYCVKVRARYTDEFWRVFSAVYEVRSCSLYFFSFICMLVCHYVLIDFVYFCMPGACRSNRSCLEGVQKRVCEWS